LPLGGVQTWWAIIGPHMVLSFGSGMIGPNASAGAVSLYPRLAGTASSLVGLVQMGLGALGTVIVAALTSIGSDYFAMPLVVGLMPFAIATVLAARLITIPPLVR
jgi:MFS transporter, DHA1 family, multidrug resistance protein